VRSWQAWHGSTKIIVPWGVLRRRSRRPVPRQARGHALRYDVDVVFERYWLPALAELERRIADRQPIRIPARA